MFRITISFFLVVMLQGCLSSSNVEPSKMVSNFYQMSASEQVRHFTNYNLDEQYELFIFGNQVVHPSAIYLARPFAQQGPIIVPFLKVKLAAANDDVTIRDIILIYLELAKLNLYNFSKDQELLDLMDQKAANLHKLWKEIIVEWISEIRKAQGPNK